MDIPTNIAQESRRVKQQLRDAGWTVTKLAARLGVSRSHASNVVRGHESNRWMQYEIARLMGREPEEFWRHLYWRHRAADRGRTTERRAARQRRTS